MINKKEACNPARKNQTTGLLFYSVKNHLALGDGEIDLAERLQLAESRHARCVLETKTIRALKQSVQWLRNNRKA